jgi:hypothetical protein
MDESLSNVLKKEQKILKNKFGEIKKHQMFFISQNSTDIPIEY